MVELVFLKKTAQRWRTGTFLALMSFPELKKTQVLSKVKENRWSSILLNHLINEEEKIFKHRKRKKNRTNHQGIRFR